MFSSHLEMHSLLFLTHELEPMSCIKCEVQLLPVIWKVILKMKSFNDSSLAFEQGLLFALIARAIFFKIPLQTFILCQDYME